VGYAQWVYEVVDGLRCILCKIDHRELRSVMVALTWKHLYKWLVDGGSLLIQNNNISARQGGAIICE